MDWPAFAKKLILADQRVGELETAILRRAVLADGKVDREEVEFLVALKREAVSVHPDFDRLLFDTLKRVGLADGVISDAEARWLRKTLFADRQATPAEVAFLTDLRRAAKSVSPEFEALYKDCTCLSPGDFLG